MSRPSSAKLAFLIAGAQKSGTTTLDAILREHPQIQMAGVKETHFFDDETRGWDAPDYGALDAYFTADGRLRGEATPITMYWRPAVRRLRDYNPGVRLVVLLRNPVTRAFSNWRHEVSHNRETMSFAEAIRGGRLRVRHQGTAEGLHRYFAYVERGLYGDQLTYLASHFPKGNIHCEIYEEFFQTRRAGLERIASFLRVDPFPETTPDLHLNASRPVPDLSGLTAPDAAYLSELYAAQIAVVEEFLGRPIPAWRVPARPS